MTNYEEQANEFLSKTGTEFSAKFLKHDKYFDDDKESRDIYEITLKRGEREYKFKFGQSINNSGLQLYHQNGERTRHKGFILPDEMRIQFETATNNKKMMGDILSIYTEKQMAKMKIDKWFKDNHFPLSGLTFKFENPSAYEVLAALTKYMPDDFEDFCSNYGYDTDSRKAEKIYKDVVDEVKNLMILYNDKEMEMLQEIS